MKFLPIGCLSLLLWVGCGGKDAEKNPVVATEDLPGAAVFADSSLEAAVRQALQQPAGNLSAEGLLSLVQLDASNRGITELKGIERLKSLTALDLADNQIRDLAPLTALYQLKFLDLDHNQVSDLSPLAALSQLEVLVLDRNQVQDLTPLLGLVKLKSVELAGNPLSQTALNDQLPALQRRGVEVSLQAGEAPVSPTSPAGEPQLLLAYVEIHKIGSGGTNDIYLLKTDGSEPVNLTNKPAGYGPVAWSPDGAQLAYLARDDFFIHGQNIFVVNADGSGLRRLLQRYDSYSYLAWSLDGTQLACTHYTSEGPRVVVVDVATGQLRVLSENNDSEPAWSPDGQRIAFKREAQEVPIDTDFGTMAISTYDLYVVNADGSDPVKLTSEAGLIAGVSWSPDGQWLVFAQALVQGRGFAAHNIYRVNSRGGLPVNLTTSPENGWGPVWSPDGLRITFMSFDHRGYGSSNIYVMSVEGGDAVNLSGEASALKLSPKWSADGKQVAYMRRGMAASVYELQVADLSGAPPVSLTPHGVLIDTDAYDFTWLPR